LLTRLGLGAIALTAGSVVTSIGAYILPKVSYEPSSSFTIGWPEDYRVGEMKLLDSQQIFVFRTTRGFQVVSDICTHLGCAYKPYQPPDEDHSVVHAHCPCHGSIFARDGQVLGGPAPRPVPFYHISLSPSGMLVVDKGVYDPTDELSRASGEGIGHNLYLDPETGQLIEGLEPTGEDLNFG
jgi:cytochrome b6-f complex iron-sulfur subunit